MARRGGLAVGGKPRAVAAGAFLLASAWPVARLRGLLLLSRWGVSYLITIAPIFSRRTMKSALDLWVCGLQQRRFKIIKNRGE